MYFTATVTLETITPFIKVPAILGVNKTINTEGSLYLSEEF